MTHHLLGLTAWLLSVVALTSACYGPIRSLYPPAADDSPYRVWIVRHDWHTGVALRRQDVPRAIWPEAEDFAGATYLEIGWGQREFYQAEEGSVWLALKATFWRNDSALHVAGFSTTPAAFFAGLDVVELDLSARGFEALAGFVAASYARTEEGRAIPLGRGKYAVSRFYLGREPYQFTTCNVWTARALRAGGLPITPRWALTAGTLMFQVESALVALPPRPR